MSFQLNSMGLRSGEYGGRNIKYIPSSGVGRYSADRIHMPPYMGTAFGRRYMYRRTNFLTSLFIVRHG